jgi:hypothetical protein
MIEYPKSSCNCKKDIYTVRVDGIPTNMSVYDCDFPDYFQNYNNLKFRSDIEPSDKTGYDYINPQVYTEKYNTDFQPINSDSSADYIPLPNGWMEPCKGMNQVFTNDPRLNSASHAQWITLDKPPIDSSMKLYEIPYDKKLDNYGQGYNSYNDINAGQIMYYVDKSIEDPFYKPNFITSSQIDGTLYKDPMGGLQPRYYRTNLKDDDNIGPVRDNYEGCLSWMQDSLNQREDIMSLQMGKMLKQQWTPRYSK